MRPSSGGFSLAASSVKLKARYSFFQSREQFSVSEMITCLNRAGQLARDDARDNPKIDGWVLVANFGDYGGAVFPPIQAKIAQEIFCEPIPTRLVGQDHRFPPLKNGHCDLGSF